MTHVSPSGVRKELLCARAGHIHYVEGVRPLTGGQRWRFGKAYHALIEPVLRLHHAGAKAAHIDDVLQHQGEQLARETFAELRETDGVSLPEDEAFAVLEVIRLSVPKMELDSWETCTSAEGTACVEIELRDPTFAYAEGGGYVELLGRVDWIAKHKPTSLAFVIDHKTTASLSPEDALIEHDLQLALYRHLAAANDLETHGALIHQVKAQAQSVPKRVRKGKGLSLAKINTTWESYRAHLVRLSFNVADYEAEMKPKLEGFRVSQWLRDLSSDESRAESVETARAVGLRRHVAQQQARVLSYPEPSRGRHCKGCDSKAWCDAVTDGLDPRSLLGSVYRLSGDRTAGEPRDTQALTRSTQRELLKGPFSDGRFHP